MTGTSTTTNGSSEPNDPVSPSRKRQRSSPDDHDLPPIRDDPDWTNRNVTVITSDRVRFKVKDYVLYSARCVQLYDRLGQKRFECTFLVARLALQWLMARTSFIHAHIERVRSDVRAGDPFVINSYDPLPQKTALSLTDYVCEHSVIFRMFLELSSTLRLPFQPVDFDSIDKVALLVCSLVGFLQKWGCRPLENLLYTSLRTAFHDNDIPPMTLFLRAAFANNAWLCALVIREADIYDNGFSPFHPGVWSLDTWRYLKSVPPEYMYALVAAWNTHGHQHGRQFADEFETQLRIAKNTPPR